MSAEEPLAAMSQQRKQPQRHQPGQQVRQVQVAGVERRDDRDGDQIVGDGEGEQKGAQRGREVRADDGQHGQGESDVRRGGNRPADPGRRVRRREREVDHSGHRHATDRGDDRHQGGVGVPQITGDELALQFETDQEEEHRQQPVGRPVPDRQPQVQAEEITAEFEIPQPEVGLRREVGAQHRGESGRQEQEPTGGLPSQNLLDPEELAASSPGQDHRAVGHQIFTRSAGSSHSRSVSVTPKAA